MRTPDAGRLFATLPARRQARELETALLALPGLRIERIVSTGQSSPPGFWYDQSEGEWVVLLAGEAELRIEDEAATRRLAPGDWLHLPPHCRHRVERTAPEVPTVWLAVYYDAGKTR